MKQLHILDINDAYDSIDELWLYNLNKYFETNDANWFIQGYSGRETKLDPMRLQPIATKLCEQYYDATGDRSMEIKVKIAAKIDALFTKFVVCSSLIQRMWKGFGDSREELEKRYKFIEQLNKWGFKMDVVALPSEDAIRLQEIQYELEGIETQIAIERAKLKKKQQGEPISMAKMLVIAEKGLGLQRKIDPKQTTVSEWVGMLEQLKEIAEKN